jgi:CheY-like chemotaxis protein
MVADATSQMTRQILVLSGSQTSESDILNALKGLGSVRIVDDVGSALEALRAGTYHLVVSEFAEFLPLAKAAGHQHAEAVLELINHGVCMVDLGGAMVWANAKLKSYPHEVLDALREHCSTVCAAFAREGASAGPPRTRRTRIDAGRQCNLDVTCSPAMSNTGEITHVVAMVVDTTSQKRLQEKINAIDAAGAELVGLDLEDMAEMEVIERLQWLEERIINYTRDLMHFDNFCVRLLDKKTNRLDTVLASGMSEEAKSLPLYAETDGNGISGYVAGTGRSYICPDVTKDPRYLPGIDNAHSSLTVPLKLHDRVIGVFNVESERIAAFTEDDRQFADIFARYVAIAVHTLQLLAVERSTTSGQIAEDVSQELTGPIDDIAGELTSLMEDNAGNDALARRLRGVLEHVDMVKRTIRAITEHTGVSGIAPIERAQDPILDGRSILVADDEDIIRETIAEILSKHGARVVTASDGDAAITTIETGQLDLVLSDIKMPQRDGYEIFSAVKRHHPETPVILITGFGYDPNHSIVRASREGLAAVLFKPFKVEQLLKDVRNALTAGHS